MVLYAGMPTESHKKRGTTSCGKLDGELPLPVGVLRTLLPPILSEIISADLDESQESIFWCKKSGVRRKISIPVYAIGESLREVH